MLEDKVCQILTFGSAQVGVLLRALIQRNLGELGLNLFHPSKVFFSELNGFLRVVLELDLITVLFEVVYTSEGICDLGVTLQLPAPSVTLDRGTVSLRFANCLDPSVSTLAIYADFCFTWNLGADFIIWMAQGLTSVTALKTFFVASFSATIFKKCLTARNALSRQVTNLLTHVATLQLCFASLTTADIT